MNTSSSSRVYSRPGVRGFTLIELLVVIAIIAILAAMLLPSLTKARAKAQGVQCLTNTKQLMLAWRMYADDYIDRVPNNFGVDETHTTITAKTFVNWVNNVMSWDPDDTWGDFNPDYIRNGVLAPFLGKNLGVYKCPADVFVSPQQRAVGRTARARSISMNAFFGPYNENPKDNLWPRGINNFMQSYRQWLKIAQVARPANYFVTIDEHPDGINDGYFLNNPAGMQSAWGDTPASYHNGACGISFADGHSEIHKWRGTATKIPVKFGYSPPQLDAAGRVDYDWLVLQRTAVPLTQ